MKFFCGDFTHNFSRNLKMSTKNITLQKSNHTPSVYQQAIYDYIKDETGNILCQAAAGAGKTSTIVGSLQFIPEGKSILMLSFNKSIAVELSARVPTHVIVNTFNALGHSTLFSLLNKSITLNNFKKSDIVKIEYAKFLSGEGSGRTPDYVAELYRYQNEVVTLVQYAMRMGIVPNKPFVLTDGTVLDIRYDLETGYIDNFESWNKLANRYDIQIPNEFMLDAIEIAANTIVRNTVIAHEQGIIDFDDQIYLPVIHNTCIMKQYDYVFVDECQDLSALRLALVEQVVGDRVIFVGDSRQCLYGFTGSDIEVFDKIESKFRVTEFPLSISYRCAKLVVHEAQALVPSIEASNTAKLGEVNHLGYKWSLNDINRGDLIVSRCNAPLLGLAWDLFNEGNAVCILGKDIGKTMINLIKKIKTQDIAVMLIGINQHLEAERTKWATEGKEHFVSGLEDRVRAIEAIVKRSCYRSVNELMTMIESRFAEQSPHGRITLGTIHKCKGLESDTVWFLNQEAIPVKYAKQSWQLEQEYNAKYVGITRAISTLNYISLAKD